MTKYIMIGFVAVALTACTPVLQLGMIPLQIVKTFAEVNQKFEFEYSVPLPRPNPRRQIATKVKQYDV